MPTLLHIFPQLHTMSGQAVYSTTRGPITPAGATLLISNQRLASDSIGTCDINIVNAISGSRYRIEVASTGDLVAEGDVSSADFSVSVPLYPAGSAANTLKVKIRKGTTAPKYQPFETQVTAVSAGALAYVSQVPDTIA